MLATSLSSAPSVNVSTGVTKLGPVSLSRWKLSHFVKTPRLAFRYGPSGCPTLTWKTAGRCLIFSEGHLLAVAVGHVAEWERDAEEVGPEIEPAPCQRRVRVVGGQEGPAEEDGDLFALSPEVEVEVLDPHQGQRIVERVVVEGSEQTERALPGDLLLDEALSRARGVRHQVAHPFLGVADHLRLRRVGGGAASRRNSRG